MSLKGEVNLAPYSFFNSVSSDPPMVMFASDGRKDTLNYIEQTGEFVCNLAVWDLREAVKETSWTFPCGVNEMEAAGLESAPSLLVKPPRVKATPCALECKWLRTIRLDDIDGKPAPRFIAFGQVIGVHIDERFIKDGLLDTAAMKPIMRAGYHDYFVASDDTRFSMRHFKNQRPDMPWGQKEIDE